MSESVFWGAVAAIITALALKLVDRLLATRTEKRRAAADANKAMAEAKKAGFEGDTAGIAQERAQWSYYTERIDKLQEDVKERETQLSGIEVSLKQVEDALDVERATIRRLRRLVNQLLSAIEDETMATAKRILGRLDPQDLAHLGEEGRAPKVMD